MDARRFLPLILFLALAAGCKHAQKYDLIEAELRTRNRELAEARAELEALRGLNHAYQSNLARTADPVSRAGAIPSLPLAAIELGSGTGGTSSVGKTGDDGLQVVLIPKDADGSAVKAAGQVVILAYEIAPGGVKTPIGRWDVAPENLRKHWRSGVFSTGYYLLMSWDKPPRTEKIRVAVRLTTLDGRVYETDRDVTVRPLTGISPSVEELPPPVISNRPAVRLGGVSAQ